MKFKDAVILELVPEMSRALPEIDRAYDDLGVTNECVVTSAHDGTHMKGSLHYEMKAVDLRSHDLTESQVGKLALRLRARLNGDALKNRPYQIVIETKPAHVHIEFQP